MTTCAAFFWSKYIQLHWHFIILCSTCIWGCFCFFVSERFLSSPYTDVISPKLEIQINDKPMDAYNTGTINDEYLKKHRCSTFGDYDKY